jgi:hypothetical protein
VGPDWAQRPTSRPLLGSKLGIVTDVVQPLQCIWEKDNIMIVLLSIAIIAGTVFAALIALTWCVQFATGWHLPTPKDHTLPFAASHVKPIHARS